MTLKNLLALKDGLEENNIEVRSQDVEVGNTYPIYGMITKFLDQKDDCLEVEINFSIKAKMVVPEADNVEILKRRSFEPGIFISEILSKDEGLEVKCNTVVFGKQKEQELNYALNEKQLVDQLQDGFSVPLKFQKVSCTICKQNLYPRNCPQRNKEP